MREQRNYTMILNYINEEDMIAKCLENEEEYLVIKQNRDYQYHMSVDGLSFWFCMTDEQMQQGVCELTTKEKDVSFTLYTQEYYDTMTSEKESEKQHRLGTMRPIMAK